MNGYILTVKTGSGEEIKLSTKKDNSGGADVTGAIFKMNTLNDNAVNRQTAVRAELTVSGFITAENKEEILKLAQWSMDSNPKTIYRDVTLEVYVDQNCQGDKLRIYEIKTMFVLDYSETFLKKQDASDGTFNLFLVQQDGKTQRSVKAF